MFKDQIPKLLLDVGLKISSTIQDPYFPDEIRDVFPTQPEELDQSEKKLFQSILVKTFKTSKQQAIFKMLCDKFLAAPPKSAVELLSIIFELLALSSATLERELSLFTPDPFSHQRSLPAYLRMGIVSHLDDPDIEVINVNFRRVLFSQKLTGFFRSFAARHYHNWVVTVKETVTISNYNFLRTPSLAKLITKLHTLCNTKTERFYLDLLRRTGFSETISQEILDIPLYDHDTLNRTLASFLEVVLSTLPKPDEIGFDELNLRLAFRLELDLTIFNVFCELNDQLDGKLDLIQWLIERFYILTARAPPLPMIVEAAVNTPFPHILSSPHYPSQTIQVVLTETKADYERAFTEIFSQQPASSGEDSTYWFHGTVSNRAMSILSDGIIPSRGNATCDFGSAFYMTQDYQHATIWSHKMKSLADPVVLIYKLAAPDETMLINNFRHVRFPLARTPEWTTLVSHCRCKGTPICFCSADYRKVQWIDGPEASVSDKKVAQSASTRRQPKLTGGGWKPRLRDPQMIQRAIVQQKAATFMNSKLIGLIYYRCDLQMIDTASSSSLGQVTPSTTPKTSRKKKGGSSKKSVHSSQ